MKRLTMSLDDALAAAFDALMDARGYANRSEAFRDLLRHDLGEVRRVQRPAGPCVATLSFLYNHHQRQLAMRLTDMQHEHHELTVATTHAHLDHDHCIETIILRGRTDAVQAFAQSVIAQPGVSHGHLHLVPVASRHAHGHEHLGPTTVAAAPPAPKAARVSGRGADADAGAAAAEAAAEAAAAAAAKSSKTARSSGKAEAARPRKSRAVGKPTRA